MNKKLRTEAVDRLFDAILSLENREECYTFFEDICTVEIVQDTALYQNAIQIGIPFVNFMKKIIDGIFLLSVIFKIFPFFQVASYHII